MGYSYPKIYLRGLDPVAGYRLRALDGTAGDDTAAVASGAYWMRNGLSVNLRGDFQAAAFLLEKVEPSEKDTR
jgi:alpha-galactosidase